MPCCNLPLGVMLLYKGNSGLKIWLSNAAAFWNIQIKDANLFE